MQKKDMRINDRRSHDIRNEIHHSDRLKIKVYRIDNGSHMRNEPVFVRFLDFFLRLRSISITNHGYSLFFFTFSHGNLVRSCEIVKHLAKSKWDPINNQSNSINFLSILLNQSKHISRNRFGVMWCDAMWCWTRIE